MVSELPESIDCRQLAAGDGRLAGGDAQARLRRVAGPYRLGGELDAVLVVAHRTGGGYALSGRLEAPLQAQCQRCLEWMDWPVSADLNVVAVDRSLAPQDAQ